MRITQRIIPPPSRQSLAVRLLALTAAFFFTTACSQPSEILPDKDREVTFRTNIESDAPVRASGTDWEEDDAIGVFMFPSGQSLTTNSVLRSNVKYVTEGDGVFIPELWTDRILLPEDGTPVDFISYYPYRDDLQGLDYPIDLSNQTVLSDVDLLYSNDAKVITADGKRIEQTYDHLLSRVVLNVTSENGVELADFSATVNQFRTKGTLDLATGRITQDVLSYNPFNPNITTTSSGKKVEFFVMPTEAPEIYGVVVFSVGNQTFTWYVPYQHPLEKGQTNTWNITLKDVQEVDEPEGYQWIELPVKKDIEGTTMVHHFLPGREDHRNYSLLYDKNYKISYWVAYPLHPMHLGDYKRGSNKDPWTWDPKIPQSDQPNLSSSYVNGTTWNRGHQIASADRTYNQIENASTFYYTNSTPQYGPMNGGRWADLEKQLRTWATNIEDTLWVVTGAALPDDLTNLQWNQTQTTPPVDVARPEYYYKAVAKKVGDTYYTIGFRMPNETVSGIPLRNFQRTVKELEEMTGFTFFPLIPPSAKEEVVSGQWPY